MDDVKQRALDKMKGRAMNWYTDMKSREVADVDAPIRRDISESENPEQELRMLRDIKKAVAESSIERKDIVLMTLHTLERQLEKGQSPQNFPIVVKNLGKKPEIAGEVSNITKRYMVGASSYYYMWGLGDE